MGMNEEQKQRFKTLWNDLEDLDQAARGIQLAKNNRFHSMISDAKSASILVSETYKHYLDAKARDPTVDFYDVMLDLLEKKVAVLTVMASRWWE